jgi:flagellar protein FlbD
MIELTRLNGSPISINCDLIKYVDSAPDTLLTLVTGEKLVVLESRADVTDRIVKYRASVFRMAWPDAETALSAKSARTAQDAISEAGKATT